MKNIISMNRIWFLLKNEMVRNRKFYMMCLCVMASMYAIAALTGPNGFIGVQSGFQSFFSILTVIIPLVIYGYLFHSVKGVRYTLLPASQEEKFLVNFLQCTVIFPAYLLVTGLALSCLGAAFTGDSRCIWNVWSLFTSHDNGISWGMGNYEQISRYALNLGFFNSKVWNTLVLQSFFLWGVYFFKEKKTRKVILTALCVIVGLSIIGSIIMKSYMGYWTSGAGFDEDAVKMSVMRFATIADIILSFVAPLGFWIWAFLKGRKQQF